MMVAKCKMQQKNKCNKMQQICKHAALQTVTGNEGEIDGSHTAMNDRQRKSRCVNWNALERAECCCRLAPLGSQQGLRQSPSALATPSCLRAPRPSRAYDLRRAVCASRRT